MRPTIVEAVSLGHVARPLPPSMRDAFAGANNSTTYVYDGKHTILYNWDDEGNRRMECYDEDGNGVYAVRPFGDEWPEEWGEY